jgi:thioredoxin reductase
MNRTKHDTASIAAKPLPLDEQVDLAIIGAGPAGRAAAIEAARLGLGVLLIDENPVAPLQMGQDIPLLYGQRGSAVLQHRGRMLEHLVATTPEFAEAFELGVDVRLGVDVWGAYANGPSLRWLPGPVLGLADQDRSWMVGVRQLIVAAGARDLALGFPGWDRPGVVGALGALSLVQRYDAFAGRRMIILGSGALALDLALCAHDRGVEIAAIVEAQPGAVGPADLLESVQRRGIPLLAGHVPAGTVGGPDGVRALSVAPLDGDGRARPDRARTIEADTICLAIGAVPNIELLDVLGCRFTYDRARGGHVPLRDTDHLTSLPFVRAIGDCAGVSDDAWRDAATAVAEGRQAARAAARALGRMVEDSVLAPSHGATGTIGALDYRHAWSRALTAAGGPDVTICQCEEVTARELLGVRPPRYLGAAPERQKGRDFARLVADGPANLDQVKRLTRAGMGPCQGRRCREQVALLLADAAGLDPAAIPLATHRPPVRPVPLGVFRPVEETVEMRRDWDVWFGIASQWTPYWEQPADDGAPQGK